MKNTLGHTPAGRISVAVWRVVRYAFGMAGTYERMQIESLLQRQPAGVIKGTGLVLLPDAAEFMTLHRIAIAPAFKACELDAELFVRVFDSDSHLSDACRHLATAEVIVADITEQPAHLMYILGLSHALGRCPILLTQDATSMPFNLASLRYVEYLRTNDGMLRLREDLSRAIRVFLQASRHG